MISKNSRLHLFRPAFLTHEHEEFAPGFALTDYVLTDPEILGGETVFRGTRVPVLSLFEHLESGCSLEEFLENFLSDRLELQI
jgi:uncharacterized protein (DUF433 family)